MSRKVFLLYLLVFCSGFASMSVELAAVRALAPFFGASVFVWTNVLGVVLAALSLGYFVAGKLSDSWKSERSLALALLWGGGFAVTAPYLAQALAASLIPSDLRLEDSFPIFWGGSIAVGLLAFAPAAFLLSFTSPAAIRFLSVGESVGKVSGRVFALSTAGSILGTFLTTYFLVPFLGTRLSFMAAGVAVLLPAAMLLATSGKGPKGGVLQASILWVVGAGLTLGFLETPYRSWGLGKLLAEKETRYQLVQIRGEGNHRWVQVNEGLDSYQSLWVEGEEWTGAYYDEFLLAGALAEISDGEELRVCVLGLGGGSVSRLFSLHEGKRKRLQIDGVEIDPGLVELAAPVFDLGPSAQPSLRILTGLDARMVLKHAKKDYDAILLDAYAAQIHIPFHLASREFFRLMWERLREGGVMAVNVGLFHDPASQGKDDPVLRAIAGTAASVFGETVGVCVKQSRNVVLFARKGKPLPAFEDLAKEEKYLHLRPLLRRAAFPGVAQRWSWEEMRRESPPFVPLTDDRSALEELQILTLAAEGLGRKS